MRTHFQYPACPSEARLGLAHLCARRRSVAAHACTCRDTRAAAQASSASAGLVFPAELISQPLRCLVFLRSQDARPSGCGCAAEGGGSGAAGRALPGRSPGREMEPREPGRFLTLGVLCGLLPPHIATPPAARCPSTQGWVQPAGPGSPHTRWTPGWPVFHVLCSGRTSAGVTQL